MNKMIFFASKLKISWKLNPLIIFFIFLSLYLSITIQAQTFYNKIVQQKTIMIGISQNYPPLNFIENNERKGIEIDMIHSISEFLDAKPILVQLNVSDYVKALEDGRVQLVIAGMSRTLDRSKKIWFSDPYMTIHPAALIDNRLIRPTKFGEDIEDTPVNNLWHLNKKNKISFIVKEGSVYESLIKTDFGNNHFIKASSNEEGLEFLTKYKANAFLHDSLFLEYLLKTNSGLSKSFTLLRAADRDEYLCIGMPFGDSILKNQVNAWIAEIIRTKQINRWMEKYLKDEINN